MKILILGASGMLGHMVSLYFKKKYSSDIILCSRSKTNINSLDKILKNVTEYSKDTLSELINNNRPCKIINCVGIKNSDAKEEELNLELIRNKILGGVLVLVIIVLIVFK